MKILPATESERDPTPVHLTWKTVDLPDKYQVNVDAWRRIHPEYQIRIYDDADLETIIARHYPEYLSAYHSFDKQINRVDFARLAMLDLWGGIYADMDVLPLKRFDSLVGKGVPIFGLEAKEHCSVLYSKNEVVCNALMISPPPSGEEPSIWRMIMDDIVRNYEKRKDQGVVASTGPIALTDFFENNLAARSRVEILSACEFFPLLDGTNTKLGKLPPPIPTERGEVYVSRECDLSKAYAVHLWDHSWIFTPRTIFERPLESFCFFMMIVLLIYFSYLVFFKKN